MSKIQVNEDSNVLDVEILPSKNEKSFWILWSVLGISIGGYGLYEFGVPKLRTLPLWLIFLVFFAIPILKIWSAFVWYSRGSERLRIMQGKLLYERSGSFLDRKRVELIASDIKQCVVLWFGLGDNLEPSRVQLKMRKGSLYIGRNLSKAQAEYFCGLLNRFVSNR